MHDLPSLILALRPDLRAIFARVRRQGEYEFWGWLLSSGAHEYRALHEDPDFLRHLSQPGHGPEGSLTLLQYSLWRSRPDLRKAFPLPGSASDYLRWFYSYGIEDCAIWPYLDQAARLHALSLPQPWAPRIRAAISRHESGLVQSSPMASTLGANLIGYVFGQLGIGEDVRMAGRALRAARVPFRMIDFPPGSDIPNNDRSMESYVGAGPDFSINLFCLTAEETGRFYATNGSTQFHNHYNIGYWPWELSRWPKDWEMMLELVDEVWVSTRHTRDALLPVTGKPVHVMPMAVELGPVRSFGSRKDARQYFKLPASAKLFCFSFDLKSWVQRKNPQACIEAFLKAFPLSHYSAEQVGIVIKVHRPSGADASWERLKSLAARDNRIHIIEETFQRPELLALYQACDCFLSLHRAEGFGRGLAEALQLGLHVICTGYSGNVDFCRPPHADLVRYKLVKVRKDEYVHPEGQVWAEPDVQHAAQLMRQFVESPSQSRKTVWKEFSALDVGKRYEKRLREIWHDLEMRSTATEARPAVGRR